MVLQMKCYLSVFFGQNFSFSLFVISMKSFVYIYSRGLNCMYSHREKKGLTAEKKLNGSLGS